MNGVMGIHGPVLGFIGESCGSSNNIFEGLPVYAPEVALKRDFHLDHDIDRVIVPEGDYTTGQRAAIIQSCLSHGVEAIEVPTYDQWINGELASRGKGVAVTENILGRKEVDFCSQQTLDTIQGQKVLITGGAGSIGCEIVRQLLPLRPAHIIVLDRAETAMHELALAINGENKYPNVHIEFRIADITDAERMDYMLERVKPDFIFHAAAYKHVPLMESHAYEAFLVNVAGTKTIADLAVKFQVKKFVLVSTDKAINPTSVMGATKKLAENYIQGLSYSNPSTQFIITRFGNVLDSNGSVTHLFKKQIQRRKPITLTHREVTRYLMTTSEACGLVLEACAMGNGGEIFIFDMGEPVKVYDIARIMIRSAGLIEEKDVPIVITGLRPGDKLHEELLACEERTQPTEHPKIMKAMLNHEKLQDGAFDIDQTKQQLAYLSNEQIVELLKKLVPEFGFDNSTKTQASKDGNVHEWGQDKAIPY